MILAILKCTLMSCLAGTTATSLGGASRRLNKFSINHSGQLIVSIVIKSLFAKIDSRSLHGNELVNSHCKNSSARTVTKRCSMCSNVDELREPGCRYLYVSSTLAAAPFSTLRNALQNVRISSRFVQNLKTKIILNEYIRTYDTPLNVTVQHSPTYW